MNTRIVLCCALALPFGCAKKSADTASVTAEEAPVTQASVEEPQHSGSNPNQAAIVISPELATMCEIPTAHFDFDSSRLGPDARTALQALAECFDTGPAAGKSMRLVGHADPRGTEEYNLALGQRRAGSVAVYLAEQGIDDVRMESSSRGELEATGTDEESWAMDRKVEISLAP